MSLEHRSGLILPEWIVRFFSVLVTASGSFALAWYLKPDECVSAFSMFLLTLAAYLHLSLGTYLIRSKLPFAAFLLYSGILICLVTSVSIKEFSNSSDLFFLLCASLMVLLYLSPGGIMFPGFRYITWAKPLSITLAWILSLSYTSSFVRVWEILPSLFCLILSLALAGDLAHYRKDLKEEVLTIPGRFGRFRTVMTCGFLCVTSILVFPDIQVHPEWIFTLSFLFLLILITSLKSKDSQLFYMLTDAGLWLLWLFN